MLLYFAFFKLGRSHTFDLCVSCRSIGGEAPREWTFSSIGKNEYTRLLSYLHGKQNIEVKNMLVESGRRGGYKKGQYAEDADAAMNMFGDTGDGYDEGSEADSDFDMGQAAKEQSSSDDSDDSDATGSDEDDNDGGSSRKRKRKKRDKENKSAKKTKKKSSPTKGRKIPKKDPNEPKRPLSSFMLFSQKHRDEIKAKNPDVSFGQVGKLLGQSWKDISPEEKAVIENETAEAKAAYDIEYKTYMESEERKQWEAAMMSQYGEIPGVKKKKNKAGGKASSKKSGPKRARGAYAFFMQGENSIVFVSLSINVSLIFHS